MDSLADDVSIANLTGPPLISLILNWGLFGALSIQVYLYYQLFPNEPLRIRILVYTIYVLEAVQTVLLTNAVWRWLVTGFGNVEKLNLVGTDLWISVCVVGGFVAFLVQLFYAYRIRRFTENSYISNIIVAVSICSLIGALGTGVVVAQESSFSGLFGRKTLAFVLIGLWSGGGSACDILIAVSMCYYLRKGVKGVPFSNTRRLVSKLVRLTIETGTLTASLSVATLCLFYIRSSKLDYEAPLSATAKLYSTTLLAVLNSRTNLTAPRDNMISWDCPDPEANTHGECGENNSPQNAINNNSNPHSVRVSNKTDSLKFNRTYDMTITEVNAGRPG